VYLSFQKLPSELQQYTSMPGTSEVAFSWRKWWLLSACWVNHLREASVGQRAPVDDADDVSLANSPEPAFKTGRSA